MTASREARRAGVLPYQELRAAVAAGWIRADTPLRSARSRSDRSMPSRSRRIRIPKG